MKPDYALVSVLLTLLFAVTFRPASAAHPGFPADNDTLTYEIRGQDFVTYGNGSRVSYPLEIDLSHRIINHTGNWYFANVSLMFRQPPVLLSLNVTGATDWTAAVHYYANDGEIRRLYTPNRTNWSELSETFMADLLFVPQRTLPGQTVYWPHPYGDSQEWMEVGAPVGLGPVHLVGSMVLSTVGMLLNSRYTFNGTVTASTDILSSSFAGEGYWEWSLGFLTQLKFDYTKRTNPLYSGNQNATRVDLVGTCTLVSYTLTDTPIPYVPTTATTVPIPGFSIEAVLVGLLGALVAVTLIRKRRQ